MARRKKVDLWDYPMYDPVDDVEYVEVYDPPRSHPFLFFFMLTGIIAACYFLMNVMLDEASPKTTRVEQVEVPHLLNSDVAAAKTVLEELGFTVQVDMVRNVRVPLNSVFRQDPVSGALLDSNSTVRLIVSAGNEFSATPDLSGAYWFEAGPLLESFRLVVGESTLAHSDTVPYSEVISQDPPAGTELPFNSPVNIVISSGPADVSLPDVVGFSEEAARADLGYGRFNVVTSSSYSSSIPAGHVVSMDPAPGTMLQPESTVELVISSGTRPYQRPRTTRPRTTRPPVTSPESTVPDTTAPETTAPETTSPEPTVPDPTTPEPPVTEPSPPSTGPVSPPSSEVSLGSPPT